MPVFVGAGTSSFMKGDGGVGVSTMTTTERNALSGVKKGQLIFNETVNLAQYWDGSDWKSIDSPPTITNFTLDGGSTVTAATIDNEASGNATIVINGSNFDTTSGAVVFVPETSGSDVNVQSLVRNSTNQFTVTVTRTDFDESDGPYSIKLTNGSGLAATLAGAITADDSAAVFVNNANAILATVVTGQSLSGSTANASAIDPDGDAITYSITSGALPGGLSLGSSTGYITGTVSASVNTYTFTVRAASSSNTADRQFRISVVTYNTDVLVVAGGGGGADHAGQGYGPGGAGAGGLCYQSNRTLVVGNTYTVTVGNGGPGNAGGGSGTNGSNSVFDTITAIGGGSGGGYGPPHNNGASGGSGGGEDGGASPGSGIQGNSGGATGYGNNGGDGYAAYPGGGGGGGGAGAAGQAGNNQGGGDGGAGLSYSITGAATFYAGGGGGGVAHSTTGNSGTGEGGSNVGGHGGWGTGSNINGGTGNTNTGSGGGGSGCGNGGNGIGGAGGSGVVILRMLSSLYSGNVSGSPTVTTDGDYKVIKYTGSGTYVG